MNSRYTQHASPSPLAEEAIDLHSIGWHVFPIHPSPEIMLRRDNLLQMARLPRSDLTPQRFRNRAIGLKPGRRSENLVVAEIDEENVEIISGLVHSNRFKWALRDDKRLLVLFYAPAEMQNFLGEGYRLIGKRETVFLPVSGDSQGLDWIAKMGDRPPQLSVEEIDRLFPDRRIERDPDKHLPKVARQVFAERKHHYPRESKAHLAALCSLVMAGYDDQDIVACLYYFGLYESRPEYWKRRIPLARKIVAGSKTKNQIMLDALEIWAREHLVKERFYSTFMACIARARLEGLHFRATAREIAQLAHITPATAACHLKAACKRWLLVLKYKSTSGNVYQFNKEVLEKAMLQGADKGLSQSYLPEQHDIFTRGGIGPFTKSIYEQLLETSMTKKQLSAALNVICARLNYHLSKLISFGWIEKSGKCYHAIPQSVSELDRLAAELGLSGTLERRAKRYQRQREYHVSRRYFDTPRAHAVRKASHKKLEQRCKLAAEQRRLAIGMAPKANGSQVQFPAPETATG